MNIRAISTDWCSHLDRLIIKFPVWERLHGFWRTIPNFNPHMVSSEPGQDLEGKAEETLFLPRRNGNAGEREELEDEIEGANPLGVTEGAAGAVDIGSEFGGFDDEAPNEV